MNTTTTFAEQLVDRLNESLAEMRAMYERPVTDEELAAIAAWRHECGDDCECCAEARG